MGLFKSFVNQTRKPEVRALVVVDLTATAQIYFFP